jgi:hypothetical protein
MQEREQYTAPELKVVGNAEEVILGSGGVGNDIRGEILVAELEFEAD